MPTVREHLDAIFAFIEAGGREPRYIRVNADLLAEFDTLVTELLAEPFRVEVRGAVPAAGMPTRMYRDGMVYFDPSIPPLQASVTAHKSSYWDSVTFDLELGPPVRVHVESVNEGNMEERRRAFEARLWDLRMHVAFEDHREFAIEPGIDQRLGYRIACMACPCVWDFPEDDIAAAGRFDLAEHYGWGAEVESIKREARRDRQTAWNHLLRDNE